MTQGHTAGPSDRVVAVALGIVPLVLFMPALAGGVFFQRDISTYWLPQTETLVRVVADGGWPLWDPYEGFGMPLLADPSHQVLYPSTWLNFLFLPHTVYTILVVVHSWGAAAGLFLLARALGLHRLPAAVAGAAWAASGPFLSTVSLYHHFMGAAWIPWVLLALERLLQSPSQRRAVVLALVAAAQVLAGSGDMVILTAVASAGRVAVMAWKKRHEARSMAPVASVIALASVLSLGLSAAQWLPTVDMLRGTSRQAMPPGTNLFWSVHPLALLELVVPQAWPDLPLSEAMRAILFESREPFLSSLYIGLVGVLVVAGWGLPERGGFALLLIVAGALLLASLGKHVPLVPLLARLPVVSMFRYPVKVLVLASLFWALVVGAAVQQAGQPFSPRQQHRVRLVGLLAVALALAGWAAARALVMHAEALGAPLLAPAGWRAAAYEPLADKVRVAALMCVLVGVLAVWRSVREKTHPALPAVLGFLAVADLGFAGSKVNPVAPRELLTHLPPVVKRLNQQPVFRRLYAPSPSMTALNRGLVRGPASWRPEWSYALGLQESLQAPIGSRWGIAGSYDADFTGLAPRAFSRLSELMEQNRQTVLGFRLLQMASVTDVVALDRRTPPHLEETAQFPSVYAEPIRLLRVPDPVPFVSLVARTRHVAVGTAVDLLAAGELDPLSTLLVEDVGADQDGAGFSGSVRIARSRADDLAVETDSNQTSYLRVTGAFAPGWRGYVDGVSVPVTRANGVFRAVPVPAGKHTVELRYRPAAVAWGAAASLCSVLAAVFLASRTTRAAA